MSFVFQSSRSNDVVWCDVMWNGTGFGLDSTGLDWIDLLDLDPHGASSMQLDPR
jgi:hypothetical protein